MEPLVSPQIQQKRFANRYEAGLLLSRKLTSYKNTKNTVILALPRGGVPVAVAISNRLSLPIKVFVVRKLGVPGSPELGFGALAENNTVYLDMPLIKKLHISENEINEVKKQEKHELTRRVNHYRHGMPLRVEGKNIIVVDDGLATGATAQATIKALRKMNTERIAFCVPVCSQSSSKEVSRLVDKFVCTKSVKNLRAIGHHYEDFSQVSDEEVESLLAVKS